MQLHKNSDKIDDVANQIKQNLVEYEKFLFAQKLIKEESPFLKFLKAHEDEFFEVKSCFRYEKWLRYLTRYLYKRIEKIKNTKQKIPRVKKRKLGS